MAINCLQNIIGIRGCNPDVSRSGLYIQDLEGMTLNSIANTANGEQFTGKDLFQQKLELAINLLADDVVSAMRKANKVSLLPQLSNINGGVFSQDPANYLPVAALERGVLIQKNLTSDIQAINVVSVKVLANSTGTFNIKVKDGVVTNIYPVALIAGEIGEVNIDYIAQSNKVYVTLDNTALAVNDSRITFGATPCCGQCPTIYDQYRYVRINGWDGTQISNKTFGIVVNANLVCDKMRFLCKIANSISYVLLYKTGIELLKEANSSERKNWFTLSKERIAELSQSYQNEYNRLLVNIVNNNYSYIASIRDECLQCNNSKIVTSIP